MELPNILPGAETVSKYLADDNERLRLIVGKVAYNITAAAKQAAQSLINDRERVSDFTDHLDGELMAECGLSQAAEIKEIAKIGNELEYYFDYCVMKLAFKGFNEEVLKQLKDLEEREADLQRRERDIEKTIEKRLAELRDELLREGSTARGFFESALTKTEKVFDQNKITRFAYSAIAVFQEEFHELQGSSDVELLTKLYQKVIEPFQLTKMVMDKNGKLKKVITNQFTEDCNRDLFMFFCKYYNELIEIYKTEGKLPSNADERARIFHKKKRGISDIISNMHMDVSKERE